MVHLNSDLQAVVRKNLANTYERFNDVEDMSLIERLVFVLSDPAKRVAPAEGFESHAAYDVRMMLLNAKPGGVASVKATVSIFEQLGRENELSWLKETSN